MSISKFSHGYFIRLFSLSVLLALSACSSGGGGSSGCGAGSFEDNGACQACAAGHYCPDGKVAYNCSPGTYQPATSAASCLSASPGNFVDTTAAISQTACIAGYYQPNSGSTACLQSPAGSFVSSTGQAAASLCPAGKYQPSKAQTLCLDSTAGYYVSGTGATSAAACAPGSYQPNTGAASCLSASPGHFVATAAASAQSACAAGYYQPDSGALLCQQSPAGSYVSSTGWASAFLCPPGAYQPNTGQTSCILSSPGRFVSTFGAIQATPCAPGTFQANSGGTSCVYTLPGYYVSTTEAIVANACPPGYFQNLYGQSGCKQSPIAYYVDTTAAAAPTACPSGQSSPAGSTSSSACINAAILSLSDNHVHVGTVASNTTASKTLTLTNNGLTSLSVSAITLGGADAASFLIGTGSAGNACGSLTPSIPAGNDCSIEISLSNTSTGDYAADVSITSNDTGPLSASMPTVVTLGARVTDTPVPLIYPSSSSISFSGSSSQTLTIHNYGNSDLIIGNIAQADALASPFFVTADNCSGQTLTADSICTIDISFTPGPAQTYQDSFDIPSNDGTNGSLTIHVAGEG